MTDATMANRGDALARVAAYRFGPFRLRLPDRILEQDGERVLVAPKVVDTLLVLVKYAGQVVSKEQLMAEVWPDVTVVESGLSRNISVLRKAIEEDGESGKYIETVPRRGYRFVGALEVECTEAAPETVHRALSADPAPDALSGTPPAKPAGLPESATPLAAWERTPAPRPGLLYSAWGSTVVFAVLLGCLALAMWFRGEPAVKARDLDPNVKIGQHLLSRLTPADAQRAHEYFEKAVIAKPRSAEAHAGLVLAAAQMAGFGVISPEQARENAQQAAEAAKRLDPDSGFVQLADGVAAMLVSRDFQHANQAFERALQLDGNSVHAAYFYSYLKAAQGDFAGARRLIEGAIQLDPVSPALGTQYAITFYHDRDFERAEAECRRVLDRDPHFGLAHYYLALSLGFQGRYQEAEQHLVNSGLREHVIETDRAWLRALAGDRGPALRVLESQRALVAKGEIAPVSKLLLTATLGFLDESFDALDQELATQASSLLTLHGEPRLDALRKDPRYGALVRRASREANGI